MEENWYICGPTIYNDSHLGHLMTYLYFDVKRRIAILKGKKINYGMNITDIDDKILNRVKMLYWREKYNECQKAKNKSKNKKNKKKNKKNKLDKQDKQELELVEQNNEQEDFNFDNIHDQKNFDKIEKYLLTQKHVKFEEKDLTPSYEIYKKFITNQEKRFFDDLTSMNIMLPNLIVRVSDIIPDIIEYILKLIEKGYAYHSNGSVYFDVMKASKDFKISLIHDDESLSLKDEFNSEKKNKIDFALWKKAKKYEISFTSPWGQGRVAWHIECSVIIHKMFESKLDMHGGGIDLKFPHHHNEHLQTTAYTGNSNWVKKFVHTSHLHINNDKMSQSLKNFITIKEFMKTYSVRQIRLLFLKHQSRQNFELNDFVKNEVIELDKKINRFLLDLKEHYTKNIKLKGEYDNSDLSFTKLLKLKKDEIREIINHSDISEDVDDQEEKTSIGTIFKIIQQIMNNSYKYLEIEYNSSIIQELYLYLTKLLRDLGLEYEVTALEDKTNDFKNIIFNIRNHILKKAQTISSSDLKAALFEITDWIRDDELAKNGITLVDSFVDGIRQIKTY